MNRGGGGGGGVQIRMKQSEKRTVPWDYNKSQNGGMGDVGRGGGYKLE